MSGIRKNVHSGKEMEFISSPEGLVDIFNPLTEHSLDTTRVTKFRNQFVTVSQLVMETKRIKIRMEEDELKEGICPKTQSWLEQVLFLSWSWKMPHRESFVEQIKCKIAVSFIFTRPLALLVTKWKWKLV